MYLSGGLHAASHTSQNKESRPHFIQLLQNAQFSSNIIAVAAEISSFLIHVLLAALSKYSRITKTSRFSVLGILKF